MWALSAARKGFSCCSADWLLRISAWTSPFEWRN